MKYICKIKLQAQTRIQEKMIAPVHMARQEVAQIQRSWSEEVSSKATLFHQKFCTENKLFIK